MRQRKYIPSVLTSGKWQKIMVANKAEIKNKEEKKRVRKERMMKKASSLNKRKESSTDEKQLMDLSESRSEKEDWIPDKDLQDSKN